MRQIAVTNKDIQFYHSFVPSLKMKIFRLFSSYPISKKTDVLAVIRSDRILDGEIENEKLYYTKNLFSEHFTDEFLDFELHPKLRPSSMAAHNVKYLFNNYKRVMMIYVVNEEVDAENVKQFKKGVARMPRNSIFTIVNVKDENFGLYEQLFTIGQVEYKANRVYVINVGKDYDVQVAEFKGVINEINLQNFQFKVFQRIVKQNHEFDVDEEESDDDGFERGDE